MDSAQQGIANHTTFFRNVDCAYFPCHQGVDELRFNCLFCYCPLYALGPRCGGSFTYTTAGIKDCTNCTVLHDGDNGARIVRERFAQLSELARQQGPIVGDDL